MTVLSDQFALQIKGEFLAIEFEQDIGCPTAGYSIVSSAAATTSHVIYEPLELHAKLAALVPRPRFNLLGYSGIRAPSPRCTSLWQILQCVIRISTSKGQIGLGTCENGLSLAPGVRPANALRCMMSFSLLTADAVMMPGAPLFPLHFISDS